MKVGNYNSNKARKRDVHRNSRNHIAKGTGARRNLRDMPEPQERGFLHGLGLALAPLLMPFRRDRGKR